MIHLKTSPPTHRADLIARRELVGWIESSSSPVIAVVAPAGYGKTTVLSQFYDSSDRPVAWLSLDEGDRDPKVLLTGLVHALDQAGVLRAAAMGSGIESGAVLTRGIGQLLDDIDVDAKGVLILDHIEHVASQTALDVIGAVLSSARDRLQVLVASRSSTGLPFGALRAHGDLLELGIEDLALSHAETRELLEAAGVQGAAAGSVWEKTEGWPVAVYLMARAMRALGSVGCDDVSGDDAYLAEYLRSELLCSVPPEVQSFLIRSSLLPRLCGELCDHVLSTSGSAAILADLHESSSLLIPLDRSRTWFRYHSLLREFLGSELRRSHGEEGERELHRRASEWFEANGPTELALDHAARAGAYDRLARLLARSTRSMYSTGQSDSVSRWFDVLEHGSALGRYPDLAAVGSLLRALSGEPAGAERLARLAYNDSAGHPRNDADLTPRTRMVRAYQAPRGVSSALVDAEAAYDTLQHEAEWAHAACGALALATLAVDGAAAAEAIWADALWRGGSIEALPLTTVARAMRCISAMDEGDWDFAEGHLGETTLEIEAQGLETYVTSCLPFIAEARLAAHRGDRERSLSFVGAASASRALLTPALPVYSVFTLHQAARAYLELADIAGARRVTRDAEDILAIRPHLGLLVEEQASLRAHLADLPRGNVGPSSLTRAELRLLPLLVTHLKYPEIGDRLFVSRHTVKSQAMSIYRKLGANSRSEAIEKAREIGILS